MLNHWKPQHLNTYILQYLRIVNFLNKKSQEEPTTMESTPKEREAGIPLDTHYPIIKHTMADFVHCGCCGKMNNYIALPWWNSAINTTEYGSNTMCLGPRNRCGKCKRYHQWT